MIVNHRFLTKYVNESTKVSLEKILTSVEDVDIEFKPYDWKLNKL